MEAFRICDAGHAAIFRKGSSVRHSATISIALLSAMLSLNSADADVQVTFVNSFRYSGLANKSQAKREATLTEIRNTLVELGARYLMPGAVLMVKVLDMERVALLIQPASPAGEPGGPRESIPPVQLKIQYILQQDGKTILQDHETISDIDYLTNPSPHSTNEHSEAIDPEKEMLRDWFAKRFGASTSSPQ